MSPLLTHRIDRCCDKIKRPMRLYSLPSGRFEDREEKEPATRHQMSSTADAGIACNPDRCTRYFLKTIPKAHDMGLCTLNKVGDGSNVSANAAARNNEIS
jgi:hypothetical protein